MALQHTLASHEPQPTQLCVSGGGVLECKQCVRMCTYAAPPQRKRRPDGKARAGHGVPWT